MPAATEPDPAGSDPIPLTRDPAKGRLYLLDQPVWLMSPEFYLDLQTQLEGLAGKAAKGILYRSSFAAGVRTAKRMAGPMAEADDLRERLQQVADYSALTGFGSYEITSADGATAETSWVKADSLVAQIHPRSPEAVCHMYSGFLAGWLTVLFDRPVECVEVECRAKGDARCLFRTKPARAAPI